MSLAVKAKPRQDQQLPNSVGVPIGGSPISFSQ